MDLRCVFFPKQVVVLITEFFFRDPKLRLKNFCREKKSCFSNAFNFIRCVSCYEFTSSFNPCFQIFRFSEEKLREDVLEKSQQFKQKLEHENSKLGLCGNFCRDLFLRMKQLSTTVI